MTQKIDDYYRRFLEQETALFQTGPLPMNLPEKDAPKTDVESLVQTYVLTVFRYAHVECEVAIRACSIEEAEQELKEKFSCVALAMHRIDQQSRGEVVDNYYILEEHIAIDKKNNPDRYPSAEDKELGGYIGWVGSEE